VGPCRIPSVLISVCRACEGQSRNAPLRRAKILGGGQKLAVSTFHGEVALAAERKAADTIERAEGIFVLSGESEGITEDDADAYEAHGEEDWVADLELDVWGGKVAKQAVPRVFDELLGGGSVRACRLLDE
jgi:hypothetical protein